MYNAYQTDQIKRRVNLIWVESCENLSDDRLLPAYGYISVFFAIVNFLPYFSVVRRGFPS